MGLGRSRLCIHTGLYTMHASHVAATYRKGKKTAGSPKVQVSDTTARRKRKSGAKSQGSVVWLPLSNPDDDSSNTSCWVLGRRGEETGDIRSHDTAIVSGSLFARAISATNLDIGIYIILYHNILLSTVPHFVS